MNTELGIKLLSRVEGSTFLPFHHIFKFVSQQHIYRVRFLDFYSFANLNYNYVKLE